MVKTHDVVLTCSTMRRLIDDVFVGGDGSADEVVGRWTQMPNRRSWQMGVVAKWT